MQNFTFGRKGTNWFLFTFVMLIGTLPSFGQDCPSLGNPNPADFCYLDDINDLTDATTPDDTVEWYRDQALTQPIPSNELLENGSTYWAGNPDGDCDNPQDVTVTVETLDAPISQYGNVYSPYLESEDAVRTIDDLTTAIDSTSLGNEIVVYETEIGTESYQESDELIAGQSYFVGQTSPTSDCYSLRIAIRYSPDVAPAPNAESPQTFCEGATVADLEATGTSEDTQAFRWYSTDTSNPALDDSEELRSGTYYVSQIVNDEDSPFPPAESEDRTPVEVEVISFDAGEDVAETFCISEIEQRLSDGESTEELFLSLLEGRDLPSEVSFDPTIASIESDYGSNPIDTFITQATFTTEEGCEDTAQLSITVEEDYEAGDDNTTGNEVCRADFSETATEEEVESYLTTLLSDDADGNGSFSNVADIVADLNSGDGTGDFSSTYTVGEGEFCEDTAVLEFTVLESPNLEALLVEVPDICNAEIPALVNEIPEDVEALFLENFGDNIPEGVFEEGDIQTVIDDYNDENLGTFTATYTVTLENGCSESIELSRTISEGETANAGTFDNIEDVCTNEDPIDLTNLTNTTANATEGGTFTGEGVSNNIFDPSTVEPDTYTITYTVDESIDCVEGSDETTFTIEVLQGPNAGDDIEDSICLSEVIEIAEGYNPQDPDATLIDLFERFEWDGDIDGEFNPSATNLGLQLFQYLGDDNRESELILNGTYTVGDEADECGTDTSEFSITVFDGEQVDAGNDNTEGNVICNTAIEEGMFPGIQAVREYYLDLLDEGVSRDGTFEPSIEDLVNWYNNESETGIFATTYTVGEGECANSAELAVEVIAPTETDVEFTQEEVEVCSTTESLDLNEYIVEELDGAIFSGSDFLEGSTFDVAAAGEGRYDITYSIEVDGDCVTGQTSDEITILVTDEIEAEAGQFEDYTFCSNDENTNLNNELSEGATEGGMFTIDGEELENGIFSPSMMGEGSYTITYTVDESIDCVSGDDSTTFEIEVFEAPNAGPDVTESYCITDVQEMIEDEGDLITWFQAFIDDEDIDQDGEFDPSIETLALEAFAYVQNPEEDSAVFETTYSVSNENCEDSAEISITINNLEDAEAGEFDDLTFCSTDDDQNLNNFLSDDATEGGMFSINGEELENGIFSPSMMEIDNYTVTYSVDDSIDCVEGDDSIEFSIEVLEGVEAGEDVNRVICAADVDNDPSLQAVENYYLNLLADGVPTNGSFGEGEIEDIHTRYLENQVGTFTATYTVSNDNCEDSVTLTVEVLETVEAEVGEIAPQTVCSSDDDIDLFTYLTDDTTTGGTFEGYEDGIFSPSTMGAGSYDVTYTVDEDATCVEGEASTTFTITVEQGANAGGDMDVTVCSNDDLQDLFDLISEDADMDGEFTLEGDVIEDGIMDPSEFETGTYEVIYTVMVEDDECGEDDMATITITLGEAPEAPTTGDAIAFCAIDGETATRLEAEGTNLTWYSDAELSMMVNEEDVLVDGDYYVTQSSDEGCESDAAVLTVNIVDSPAPTISSDYELCEYDNPTIGDLTDEINETGEVTWYDSADGMEALSNNATLSDGSTYYATLISDNGCESSERLEVTVTLEECDIIPEAITPNGDNLNDTFSIGFLENEYPNFNVTIFNRWGNSVYEGNASTPEWDGTSNQSGSLGDDVLPVGVYFYVIDFNDGSTEPRQGKVYLNR